MARAKEKGAASAAAAAATGKGNGDRDMSKVDCCNCGKTGHLARDCRSKPKVKGKGKGSKAIGHRDRGSDGKWYRRVGINSLGEEDWVSEEDQQDDAEDDGTGGCGSFVEGGGGWG